MFISSRLFRVVLVLFVSSWAALVLAQPRITDTPVPVILPESTAQPTSLSVLTPTPTTTATEEPRVVLVAGDIAGNINVRDLPDVTGNRLGSLDPDREYPVTGRFFSWYQLEYSSSSNGLAWVFGDTVEIIGDSSTIPIIDPFAVPTAVPPEAAEAATATAFILTPGAPETATAETRLISVPTNEGGGDTVTDITPTFTPPPDAVPRESTPDTNLLASPTPTFVESAITEISSASVPPIMPILVLAGFGLLGLIVAIVRG